MGSPAPCKRGLSAIRFSIAWENGIQIPFPFFVCVFRMTLKNRFEFRFSFSPHFEKRILISFFIFRFRITFENRS